MNPPLESLAPINIQKQYHFVIESLNHKTIRSWAIIFKRKKKESGYSFLSLYKQVGCSCG